MPTKSRVTEQPVKHTPHGLGALSVFIRDVTDAGHTCLAEVSLKDAQGRSVAMVTIRSHRSDAQHIAAGHLFAAAPDLYEAIRSSIEYLDMTLGPCDEGCECILHDLHAALAKAEGRS